ncbi:hypothetical protein GWE18_29090 [Bradyrhizobium sp. CSA112]|uniref:hypothetical protein n=1 Tax=Bradyrhizobium sp. CSA112 TaxID=2699170 RepID=UPI0023B0A52C|nr:hypothetical protein [Bradyrhizobium sp. CSA112]MDE5456811.1 hypothetical protein [Bradyrhizobium sp. CSA112]
MHSFPAGPAPSYYALRIRPALTSVVDEVCGTLARLCAYLMALALIAIGGIALWDHLPDVTVLETSPKDGWSLAARPVPAFAVSQFVFPGKTEIYEILRHPHGGRKDVFRWSGSAGTPVAELEIYRPGGEYDQAGPALGNAIVRMEPNGPRELEAAGFIDSKFGTVSLFRQAGGTGAARSCLGFSRRVDEFGLQLSGWSCLGEDLPTRRVAISCMLNRLVLLAAGNEAKLAQTFVNAEARRGDCTASGVPALSADWLTGADNPRLRGAM